MVLPAPLLDGRDRDAIVHEARALAPFYTPEWAAKEDVGPGAALLTSVARMLEGLIRRLNDVPQKNFIAFLNMLGAKLLPAQPARVPLTFFLSTGARQAVPVPARSQAAASPPEGGDPIVFETEHTILTTPAQLQAIISVVPARDAIVDHTTDISSEEATAELFADAQQNLQEHSLYLAHSDLLNLQAEAVVRLRLIIQRAELTEDHFTAQLSWEWWNDTHWVPSTVPGFQEVPDVFSTVTTLEVALSDGEGSEITVQTDVESDARFPDTGLLLIDNEIVLYDRKVRNRFEGLTRGYGHNRHIPGASEAVAHTAGTDVRLIDHPLEVSAQRAEPDAIPGRQQITVTLRKGFPTPFSATEVAGIKSQWLRCRTLRSLRLQASPLRHLHLDTVRLSTAAAPEGILPIALFANDVPLDVSPEALPLYPFGQRPRTTDTFYIASDDALSKRGVPIHLQFAISLGGIASIPIRQVQGIGPVFEGLLQARNINTVDVLLRTPLEELASILNTNPARAQNILEAAQRAFFDNSGTAEATIMPSPVGEPVLSWEYWNGKGWQVIAPRQDGTNQMRQSGIVRFTCPEDITSTPVNGQEHHWMRVRIVSGNYGQEVFRFDPDTNQIESNTSQIRPPRIHQLTIRYGAETEGETAAQDDTGFETLDHCLSFNNLTFTDHTEDAKNVTPHFPAFALPEQSEQAVYLGFDPAPLKGPISLFFALQQQAYSEENRPRLSWEYLRQPAGASQTEWTRLEVVDGTRHLTESGTLTFIGPLDFARDVRFGRALFWIRATNREPLFQPQSQSAAPPPESLSTVESIIAGETPLHPCEDLLASFLPPFTRPQTEAPPAPRVQGLYLNTVWASQTETIQDEILGSGSGLANQTVALAKFPVTDEYVWVNELATLSEGERAALAGHADIEVNDVQDDQGRTVAFWILWRPLDDLTEAQATDRVYSIDRTFGQIQFGDGRQGLVPPSGRDNIKATYQAGGGAKGNVGPGVITALRTTIPLVDRVANRLPAGGGSNTEALDRALERGPQRIKHRDRAVTVEDFEWLTREASQAVARVKVLPTFNDQGMVETGWVTVIIVPQSQEARPLPSPQLRSHVEQYLRTRAANLVTFPRHVQVTGPTYVEVHVAAQLIVTQIELASQVESTALQQLRQFLHPLTGGYRNQGWEFGRLPCLSDFYALLESLDGVDHVDNLEMTLRAVTATGETVTEPRRVTEEEPLAVTMPEHTLIYGETHTIIVKA